MTAQTEDRENFFKHFLPQNLDPPTHAKKSTTNTDTMMNKQSSHTVSPVLSAKNDGAPPSTDVFARRSERPLIREERIQSPRQNSKETKIQSRNSSERSSSSSNDDNNDNNNNNNNKMKENDGATKRSSSSSSTTSSSSSSESDDEGSGGGEQTRGGKIERNKKKTKQTTTTMTTATKEQKETKKKKKKKSKTKNKTKDRKEKQHQPKNEEEKMKKKIRAAKRGTRSELSVSKGGWTKHGYAYDNANVLNTTNLKSKAGIIERISAKEVSPEEFDRRFSLTRTPCIITDAMDHWPCFMKTLNSKGKEDNPREWTIDKLQKRFPKDRFKVGSDDDGYAVRMTMTEFQFYCDEERNPDYGCKRDDSPLYVFDGSVFDKENTKELEKDFDIPSYFSEDLFKYVGHKRRPPHRWVVFGPPRSGSSVHVDPLATSAWNALISGQKRWVLYPPDKGLSKPLLKPKGIGLDGESVTWFQKAYPMTQTREWSEVGGCPKSFDVVQNAGEIMFVPDGWWHAVLNITHTVAVTQNFCTTPRFDAVYRATRRGRPKMSKKWLEKLKAKGRQDLYDTAMRQPRRSEYSENEKTSSSSSSSSEGESDTEDADDRMVRLKEETRRLAKHGGKREREEEEV